MRYQEECINCWVLELQEMVDRFFYKFFSWIDDKVKAVENLYDWDFGKKPKKKKK